MDHLSAKRFLVYLDKEKENMVLVYYNKTSAQVVITPPEIYEPLNAEFNFDFDPCPLNPTFDGLSIEWGNSNYVNPPFKNTKKWVKKGYEQWQKGKTIVFLINARTDCNWFHEYIYGNAEIRFIWGRIKFVGYEKSLPFPCFIAIFRANKQSKEISRLILKKVKHKI